MTNNKDLGADAAVVATARSAEATPKLTHAAPNGQAKRNLDRARELLWSARFDDQFFVTAVRLFEESAHLCGSIEATDRMQARLIGSPEGHK